MPASVLDRVLTLCRVKYSAPSPARSAPANLTQAGQSALRPHWPSIIIGATVFALVFAVWRFGWFQFFELQVYDRFARSSASPFTQKSRVIIIGITEEDLQRLNTYPIPDDILCDELQKLLDAQPAAVVIDLFRNLPVPGKDPSGGQRLAALFAANPNLIAIQRLGLGNEPPVPPPPFLSELPEQIGFNDFGILDQKIDGSVRRVTLMMWEGERVYYSDPLLATLLYLQTHGVSFQLDSRDVRLGEAVVQRFAPNDGAYVNAGAQGYQTLLDFRGPAAFPTYAFADVKAGKVPPEAIHGNVVVLGPLAVSLKDFISTPLDKRFPGLTLHAHIVDQLLRVALQGQRPLGFWPEWQEALWLLFWCVTGTLTGLSVLSPRVFVPVLIGSLGTLLGVYWMSMLAGTWLLVVAPATGFAGALALSISHQAYLEHRQRKVLMQLFSQHVSANIADDIWKHRDQFMDGHLPRSQVIPGTVFFTDLKGFTATTEMLPPDVLIEWLNEYMARMAALIEQHGGMVNKYMGDAIMAVFGAPIPRATDEKIKEDAINAVRCVLAMARELDQLNEDWTRRGRPTTAMRIGVASGPLISGSIGSAKRLEYTVTGNTVVTAKRLESAEKDSTRLEKASLSCRILITEETFTMLTPQFKVREIGPMRLEGKNRDVGVYVLIGEDQIPTS